MKRRTIITAYILMILLSVEYVYSQDTLKTDPKSLKNHLGITFTPAIIGAINNYNYAYQFQPLYTPSLYLEYNRILSKKIWLTAGTGLFISGFNYTLTYPADESYAYSKETNRDYDFNVSLNLKPKWILIDKKLLFYVGLSAQVNLYMTSLNYVTKYDGSGTLVKDYSESGAYQSQRLFNYYGGFILGIGYRCKRFTFIAEPEFKFKLNAEWDNATLYIPYSLGLNLIAYYNF
jgi:hypothetical protein